MPKFTNYYLAAMCLCFSACLFAQGGGGAWPPPPPFNQLQAGGDVPIYVKSVRFDHSAWGDAIDGLDIREDFDNDIEWDRLDKSAENADKGEYYYPQPWDFMSSIQIQEPCALRAQKLATVWVKFCYDPSAAFITWARIQGYSEDSSILPSFNSKDVQFDPVSGESVGDEENGFISFTMTSAMAAGISKKSVKLRWFAWDVTAGDQDRMLGNDPSMYPIDRCGDHVVYRLFDRPEPNKPWYDVPKTEESQLWTVALDHAIELTNDSMKSNEGETSQAEALKRLTEYTFEKMGKKYDHKGGLAGFSGMDGAWGVASYFVERMPPNPPPPTVWVGPVGAYAYTNDTVNPIAQFDLQRYLLTSSTAVNCFDQSYALASLAQALGIFADALVIAPFGYIKPGNIVGTLGLVNNPFFENTDRYSSIANVPVVDVGWHSGEIDPNVETGPGTGIYTWESRQNELRGGISKSVIKRSRFGTHGIVELGDKVYDSCAGPKTGLLRAAYLAEVQDVAGGGDKEKIIFTNARVAGFGAAPLFEWKVSGTTADFSGATLINLRKR